LILKQCDRNASRLAAAEAKAKVPQANLHRIAKRGKADYFQLFAFEHAHFQETLNDHVLARDGFDARLLTGSELG
jgi:hypothetical protein